MEEQSEIKYKNMFAPICAAQSVCITVILIAVIIIKFFFGGSYEKLKDWCKKTVFEETKITAAFDEELNR